MRTAGNLRRTARRSRIVAGLAAAVLALTGCTGDDDATDTDDATEDEDLTDDADDADGDDDADDGGDAASEEPPDSGPVQARDNAFVPPDIVVDRGATVTWTNEDEVEHTVTSGEPGEADGTFDVHMTDQGSQVSLTMEEPGEFAYFCEIHPDMVGSVTVM